MYKGSDIDAAQLGWFIPRKKIDLTALLDSTLKSKMTEPINTRHSTRSIKNYRSSFQNIYLGKTGFYRYDRICNKAHQKRRFHLSHHADQTKAAGIW
jgi:hypothetical protein